MAYAPSIVSWNITGACHLRCPHCYLDARYRRTGELSTSEGLRLIGQMAEAGTELLILTGGEPMARKDLLQLASHASAQGIGVVLGTTGTPITPRRARLLREAGVTAAGISLDSLDPAKHDAFRGVPGSWRAAVRGMEACREEGLELLVHTTALKMNREEAPEIAAFAHRMGARAFHLFFLVCTGRGEELSDLSPQEYEELLNYVLDAQDGFPGMMVRARCAPYIGRLAVERGMPPQGSAGCLAGTTYCRITPTGDVTPCPYLPAVAGNVKRRGFQEIWAESPELNRFRGQAARLGGKCGECSYSRGDPPLCVGCRARAYSLAGDELAADPWCLHEPGHGEGAHDAATPAIVTAVAWADDARQRLSRVPSFMRGRVKRSAEEYARQQGLAVITPEVLDILRQRAFGGAPPKGWSGGSPGAQAKSGSAERV